MKNSVVCVYSNCFVLPLYDYCIAYSAVEEIWNVIVHCFSQAIQNRLGQVSMVTITIVGMCYFRDLQDASCKP